MGNKEAPGSPLRLGFGRDLRREHSPGRLELDQWVGIEMGRNDIRPFVQDAMQGLVALHGEDGDRTTPDPRVDMAA